MIQPSRQFDAAGRPWLTHGRNSVGSVISILREQALKSRGAVGVESSWETETADAIYLESREGTASAGTVNDWGHYTLVFDSDILDGEPVKGHLSPSTAGHGFYGDGDARLEDRGGIDRVLDELNREPPDVSHNEVVIDRSELPIAGEIRFVVVYGVAERDRLKKAAAEQQITLPPLLCVEDFRQGATMPCDLTLDLLASLGHVDQDLGRAYVNWKRTGYAIPDASGL